MMFARWIICGCSPVQSFILFEGSIVCGTANQQMTAKSPARSARPLSQKKKKKSTARSLIPQAKFGGHARQSTLQGYRAKPLLSTASNATKRVAACIGTMCGARREAIIKPTGRAPEDCSVQICVRRRAEEPIADDTAARSLSWAPAARSSFYAPRTRPPRVDCSLEAERRGDRREKTKTNRNKHNETNFYTNWEVDEGSISIVYGGGCDERERELGLQKRWTAWPVL